MTKSKDPLCQTPRDINHAREILREDIEKMERVHAARLNVRECERSVVRDIHATEEVAMVWVGALSEYTKPKLAKNATGPVVYIFSIKAERRSYLFRVWPGSAAAPRMPSRGDVYVIQQRVRGAGKGLGSALFVIECRKKGDPFRDRKLHKMILQAHKACTEVMEYIDSRFENRRNHAQRNGAKE